MVRDKTDSVTSSLESEEQLSQFTESYASFNRVVNSLQRQYLELKEEYATQNSLLADVNRKLTAATADNLAANEFLNGILNALGAGVIAVDRHGVITHFNPAASMLLGIPRNEPVGMSYRSVVPPGQPPDANALRTIESGVELSSVEKKISLVDGTILYLSVSTALLGESPGNLLGAVEVLHDLTRIKKMESELARLNTMAALGEMAATIAHQVRNPLAGIGGFAALLKRDIPESDPRHRTVDKIISGVDSLNQTVTTLLNYTRTEEMNRERIDYSGFLEDTIARFRHDRADFDEKVKLSLEITGPAGKGRIHLSIDSLLMRQVFFNLFVNAVEAAGTNAEITVSCRKLPRQKALSQYADRILLGLGETVIETTVTDNGPGIKDTAMTQLFSPFFTTRSTGTGLGLAMALKVIKAHGGDIMANNTDKSGACFTVVLPAAIDQPENSRNQGNN